MPPSRVLILGGTIDARAAAAALLDAGRTPVTSLAGVTAQPLLPQGEVRIGRFGGVSGLEQYLATEDIRLVIDATHPFATQMSRHAAEACSRLNLPLLRLERPAWQPREGDKWVSVADAGKAAAALPPGARVLLTIGRKEVSAFFARRDVSGIARMIEPPACAPPPEWRVMRERPPFSLASETALMTSAAITYLVSKNAGGSATEAKLTAARDRGITVIMIARPTKPDVPRFATADHLLKAVERVLSP